MCRLLKFVPILFICCFFLSACAPKVTRVNLNTGLELADGERCPVGDTCSSDTNFGESGPGGGIGRIITVGTEGDCVARLPNGAPIVDAQGRMVMERCKQQSVAAGFIPGHLDVILPNAIAAAGGITGALIGRDGDIKAAKIQSKAIVEAANAQAEAIQNAGPSAVSFTEVQTFTNTEVGISEKTQYFDPTK